MMHAIPHDMIQCYRASTRGQKQPPQHSSRFRNRVQAIRTTALFGTGLKTAQPQSPDRLQEQVSPDESSQSTSGGSESDEEESDDTTAELPLDQVFEILKNSRRRETLRYLNENDGSATLSDVAEHIAAIENDTTVRAISSTQRKRVYVGLYQCHLPKMDDVAVVNFNKDRGTIELGPTASQLDPYLEDTDGQSWHRIYLGSIVGGTALFGLGQVIEVAYGMTATVVLFGFLIFLTALALVHAQHDGDLL
jgi:hypothetical protein